MGHRCCQHASSLPPIYHGCPSLLSPHSLATHNTSPARCVHALLPHSVVSMSENTNLRVALGPSIGPSPQRPSHPRRWSVRQPLARQSQDHRPLTTEVVRVRSRKCVTQPTRHKNQRSRVCNRGPEIRPIRGPMSDSQMQIRINQRGNTTPFRHGTPPHVWGHREATPSIASSCGPTRVAITCPGTESPVKFRRRVGGKDHHKSFALAGEGMRSCARNLRAYPYGSVRYLRTYPCAPAPHRRNNNECLQITMCAQTPSPHGYPIQADSKINALLSPISHHKAGGRKTLLNAYAPLWNIRDAGGPSSFRNAAAATTTSDREQPKEIPTTTSTTCPLRAST